MNAYVWVCVMCMCVGEYMHVEMYSRGFQYSAVIEQWLDRVKV